VYGAIQRNFDGVEGSIDDFVRQIDPGDLVLNGMGPTRKPIL
jgi:hypothetical protein